MAATLARIRVSLTARWMRSRLLSARSRFHWGGSYGMIRSTRNAVAIATARITSSQYFWASAAATAIPAPLRPISMNGT